MPQRVANLLIAVSGLLIVFCLIISGFNPRRSITTGPRWKRRLIAAGILLLAALGIGSCGEGGRSGTIAPGRQPNTSNNATPGATPAATRIEKTNEWKQLVAIWKEASEIADGKRGACPFDHAGKKRVLSNLAAASAGVNKLQKAGLLSPAEAGLLDKDLAVLVQGVKAKRPTEMRATCYLPMVVTPAKDSYQRLADRLPLLENLAASDTLKPEVLEKILGSIERDVATLANEKHLARLSETERAKATKVRDTARTQLQEIRRRLNPDALVNLEGTDDWRRIMDTWKTAVPLAESGKSTTAQREAAKKKLEAACEAALRLAKADLLSDAEARLLCDEAERLRKDIYRNPPTDCRVMCYDMAFMPPARSSLDSLSRRLPLLRKIAANGKLQPAAMQKIIPNIEADIKTLSDEKQVAKLSAEAQATAKALVPQVQAALAEIKGMLGEKQ